jgi:hypothetical protein
MRIKLKALNKEFLSCQIFGCKNHEKKDSYFDMWVKDQNVEIVILSHPFLSRVKFLATMR